MLIPTRYKLLIAAFIVCVIGALCWSAKHYHELYVKANADLKTANESISTMQRQQNKAAELDAKYTKDLADAQNVIDSLRDDVSAGNKRLSVKARCLPKATESSSVGDAGSAELSSDSRQDYYRLREQLATSDKQIRYLQDYIRGVVNGEEAKR